MGSNVFCLSLFHRDYNTIISMHNINLSVQITVPLAGNRNHCQASRSSCNSTTRKVTNDSLDRCDMDVFWFMSDTGRGNLSNSIGNIRTRVGSQVAEGTKD
ncbi:expressed unknown protein [Seminavis robusta]|uniref:Uncharacterized protein n=1 Tax=Seminavis robusta TaxID=568900 RepID=A0A9N8DIQ1_9STRA|nr:expressed unknown protein [Seminavis robusta]|eukprot:Sro179_g078501.1  (101) ;mRNA; f:52281-52583